MKTLLTAAVILMLSLCSVAQAISLEELILGEAPPAVVKEKFIGELAGVLDDVIRGKVDPVSLLVGLGVGPDVDNPDNEFSLLLGFRYNHFEVGPKLYFWPGCDDHSTWGVYALRHLTYDDILLGKPFVGFETTISGKDGDMYAFVAGMDTDVYGTTMRTSASFRTFAGALQMSHRDENDEIMGKVEVIFKF